MNTFYKNTLATNRKYLVFIFSIQYRFSDTDEVNCFADDDIAFFVNSFVKSARGFSDNRTTR